MGNEIFLKKTWLFCVFFFFAGCAGTKMVLVNPQKTADEIHEDETACHALAGNCDEDGVECVKAYNQCMEEKGYKLTPEKKAGKVKGFQQAWINPDIDFKKYQAILIELVDVSQAKTRNLQVPGSKVTDADIEHLGQEMGKRFSEMLSVVLPVADWEKTAGKKVLYVRLVLKDIARPNVGFNAALQVASTVSRIPTGPLGSEGLFSFEGTITDFQTGEKLVTISDFVRHDKNASLIGIENFEKWQHAYNIMDYWADCLSRLLADKRGQSYKSRIKFKLI